jgi:hypothetical protein
LSLDIFLKGMEIQLMTKTISDIRKEGGKCEKVATDFWECTDKDGKVWWCSDGGKACVEKPRISMTIEGIEKEGGTCKQVDDGYWMCRTPDGKFWGCQGSRGDSSCIIIHDPDEESNEEISTGYIDTASGAVRLIGDVTGNELRLYAQEHVFGNDRTIIAYAKYDGTQIIRSVFSHDNDDSITLIAQDNDARVKIVLQDSDDPAFGYVSVTHDYALPKTYKIDIKKFLKTKSFKSHDGVDIDVVGKRIPPKITALEIFNIFKNNGAYRTFMRGDQPEIEKSLQLAGVTTKNVARGVNWKCAWICAIPACGITCLLWKPLKSNKLTVSINASIFATV